MGQPDSSPPPGVTVLSVDWLPSGAASGLVRVRGRREGVEQGLPDLVIEHGDREHRFTSLPDPRGELEPQAWRGAYVVGAALVAAAGHAMHLEWPGDARLPLQAVTAEVPVAAAPPADDKPVGEVVDRAVLAERRARRAEAAEQAQARIAHEALRAVEVLELRANELEEKLREATSSVAPAPEPEASPDTIEEVAELEQRLSEAQHREMSLRQRVASLEEALTRRPEPAPAPVPAPALEPAPTAAASAERRAERLRDALASTIVTVGQLRLQLHEAQLARRTRDISAGADLVRRTVAERERAALAEALSAAREELRAVKDTSRRAQELEASHTQLRDELAARDEELRAARDRVTALERDVTSAREAADRASRELEERLAQAVEAAREQAGADVRDAGARAAEAEAALSALQARAAAAESALREAELAREMAEAAAVAAASERRAAEVAHAARVSTLEAELAAARREPRWLPPEPEPAPEPAPAPPPAPPRLAEHAAEQARRAAAEQPTSEHVVADLDAAAAALRERTEPEPREPVRAPEPPRRPTIVSAPSEPPASLARGTGGRSYPPLRGALVRLAHDDPRAAAELIAGLVPVQWRVLNRSLEYTLAIRELDEPIPITVTPGGAGIGREPRGARVAATAHDLAQALAGHPPRIGRFGRIRVSGPRATRKALEELTRADLSLEQAVRSGAEIDPILALRFLTYAVPAAWTRGHSFTVAQTFTGNDGDRTIYLTAGDGSGLTWSYEAPVREPDATVVLGEDAFRKLMLGEAPGHGERPATRGDHRAAEQLRSWAERVLRGDF